MISSFDFPFPEQFHFEHTVLSHGWCALLPFDLEKSSLSLRRTISTYSGKILQFEINKSSLAAAMFHVRHNMKLVKGELDEIALKVDQIFNLNLDLDPLYSIVKNKEEFQWIAEKKTGRLLRGETFFEDAIKMILTTNCSWSFTETMNTRLVNALGRKSSEGWIAFPEPASIADCSEKYLRDELKLGYRAKFIHELSKLCANGCLDIESFRTSTAPSREILKELKRIKGIGDYAAGNLLKLLGRFEYLALDSWCRSRFASLHGIGSSYPDTVIEEYYSPFDEWKGLVMWLDLTRHWYLEGFPD